MRGAVVIDARDGDPLTVSVNGEVVANNVILCISSDSRMTGLLDRKEMGLNDGILMVMPGKRAGKSGFITSIHMIGMKFDIIAAWINEEGEVVRTVLAKKWRPYYGSSKPAWYVLEMHPDHLNKIREGERVEFGVSK